MNAPHHHVPKRNIKSLIQHIQGTRKDRTILFSDIEHSTQFWSKHGDIHGRLMVDRHNWLLFPIIRQFQGWIVKTIGDSIMAAFKQPDQALLAAIAIQQALERERQTNPQFTIKVRIGLHSGAALVEHNDVFGDVVNVAARVESRSHADEILLSSETRTRLKSGKFPLAPKGEFVPKGKSKAQKLFQCRWQQAPDLLADLRLSTRVPIVPSQRGEIFLYAVSSLAALFGLVWLYVRYLLAENESLALMWLDPGVFWWGYPLLIVLGLSVLAGIYFTVFRLKNIPLTALKLLKAGFGFLAAFVLAWSVLGLAPGSLRSQMQTPQFVSKHLFVRPLFEDTAVYLAPALDSEIIQHCRPGQLLLLNDVKTGPVSWNKVLIGPNRYGWVPRVLPPDIGIPARRLTLTDRFYFRNLDLYALGIGLIGFLWGFFTFHLRPA